MYFLYKIAIDTVTISHMSSYIIMLECINRLPGNVLATLVKSPVRGYGITPLKIDEPGFLDEAIHYISG